MTSSLLQETRAVLTRGPLSTAELARSVLRLSGPASMTEAAVRALVADDPRIRKTDGVWVLEAEEGASAVPGPDSPLDALRWAVVDVETTGGGHRSGDRVTEVAVVEVAGGRITDQWSSLVNPGRLIPPRIQSLTGISNQMVSRAPPFEGIATQVEARIRGRVFTAHNASFDWGFVSTELLQATGDAPQVERLCTVKAGRRLMPGLGRYSLGALSEHLGIRNDARHRALGDALATARLLLHLLECAREADLPDLAHLQGARTARSSS